MGQLLEIINFFNTWASSKTFGNPSNLEVRTSKSLFSIYLYGLFWKLSNFILRYQVLDEFPSKELRNIVDQGKKEIKEGIVIAFCKFEKKVGVAVGITSKLIDKYDSVTFVKEAAEILGGKGGGGRKDFAQAGGVNKEKIEEAYKALSKKIN